MEPAIVNPVPYTWFGSRAHETVSLTHLNGDDFTLHFAVTEADKEDIYRFRYAIYVEEMQRKQNYADHTKKRIYEPLDEHGVLILARDTAGAVIGTVRTNQADDPQIGCYREMYRMDSFTPHYPCKVWIVTKLMVDPNLRRMTKVAIALAQSCAVLNYKAPNKLTLIDCNDYLVGYFERMGFRTYGETSHPEYGDVFLMSIDYEDQDYLSQIGSPLTIQSIFEERIEGAVV